MAVPASSSPAVHFPINGALIALCLLLTVTTVLREEQVLSVIRTAVAGLSILDVDQPDAPAEQVVDTADLPAMDPLVARVVDPRRVAAAPTVERLGVAIEPFEYEVQGEQNLADVAVRWGTTLTTLLWNNGLERGEDFPAGQKLTVLPVTGILHRVQPGETARDIADRYGVGLFALAAANSLDDASFLRAGRALVVPGGKVPMAATVIVPVEAIAAVATLTPSEDALSTIEATPVPSATAVTAELSHSARIEAAMTWQDPGLPMPSNATLSQRDFIRSIVGGARESQRITGVPASVTLAQAILESDWGKSRLSREARNLFGIKAHGRFGTAGVYSIRTWEVLGGSDVTVMDAFRAYLTYADSIVDHGRWFHQQPRYAEALAVLDDARAFARAISAAGYATDPAYGTKLIALMDRFDLYSYDVD